MDESRPDVFTLTVHGKEIALPFFVEEGRQTPTLGGCRRWRSPKKEGLVVTQVIDPVRGTVGWIVALFGPWPGTSTLPGYEPIGRGPTLSWAVREFEDCCRRWVDYLLLKETYPEGERKP